MKSYQLAKFFSHRQCGDRDIMVLDCHVISQDHIIEGSCNFIKVNYNLVKFGVRRHCGSRDATLLVCHVISHKTTRSKMIWLHMQEPIKVGHDSVKFDRQ